jgi:hypothetical protein
MLLRYLKHTPKTTLFGRPPGTFKAKSFSITLLQGKGWVYRYALKVKLKMTIRLIFPRFKICASGTR